MAHLWNKKCMQTKSFKNQDLQLWHYHLDKAKAKLIINHKGRLDFENQVPCINNIFDDSISLHDVLVAPLNTLLNSWNQCFIWSWILCQIKQHAYSRVLHLMLFFWRSVDLLKYLVFCNVDDLELGLQMLISVWNQMKMSTICPSEHWISQHT